MLKRGHVALVDAIVAYFIGILHGKMDPPSERQEARLAVIFQKGDPQLPKNYRPSSVIAVMSKLFRTVITTDCVIASSGASRTSSMVLDAAAVATTPCMFDAWLLRSRMNGVRSCG